MHSAAQLNSPNETPTAKPRYLFYRSSGWMRDAISLPAGYSPSLWSPSATNPWARRSSVGIRARFAFRWLLDRAQLFANREVGAVCIYFGNQLVHYSGFTPRYWRFPFLTDRDLQIGDTWTDPDHRGKGLARFALQEILTTRRRPGRGFWYVVGDDNPISIRVAEAAGFRLIGVGDWHKPWGIQLFGSYVPDGDSDARRAPIKQTL